MTSSSAAFSPLSLSPFVWYDFSTTAGGGAAIASISDLSGNGRTASQATGSLQPTSQSAVQNGRNVGRFDGVDDTLSTASFSLAQPFTVYAVVNMRTAGSGVGRYFASHDAAARAGCNKVFPGHDDFAGSTIPGTSAVAFDAWRQLTTVFNGASSIARANGVQEGSGAVGAGTIATGIDLGAGGGASQFWDGDLGELFAVAGSSVSTAAEAYLKARWGTP